jgi:hypothetical protein
MPATQIELTNNVDQAGYELVPEKTPPLQPGQTWRDRDPADLQPARIVGLGGKLKKVRIDSYPALFSEFAYIKTGPKLLEFITRYGSLAASGDDIVPNLLEEARAMRECLLPRRADILPPIPAFHMVSAIARNKDGTVYLKMMPGTLLNALWYQLGLSLSEGVEMHECRHCHLQFPRGGNAPRRADSDFCSDEHRKRFNSLERTKKKHRRKKS